MTLAVNMNPRESNLQRLDASKLEKLESEAAAVPFNVGDQLLGDDAAKRLGDHHTDLTTLIDREDIEDPVEGARGISGVKGSEDEVTRFGSADRRLDRFQIAQLADEHDIRIHAQGAPQRFGKTGNVGADLNSNGK